MEATIPTELKPPLMASEMSVLDYLVRHLEGACIGDIARGTLLAQSRVSTVVVRLKKRGWVETHVPPEDARSTLVSVRPEVVTGMHKVLKGDGVPVIDHLLRGASRSDRSTVSRGLTILIENLRKTDALDEKKPKATEGRH